MSTQTGRNVRIEVAATYSTPKVVTAVTKASPGVATSTSHAMADATIGYFDDPTAGMDEIAGGAYSVDAPATNTFNLEGEDTTTFGTFTSGNFVPVATWATLSVATGYSIDGGAADTIDTTRLLDRIKQQEMGLLAAQTVNVDGFSDAQNAAVALLRAAALVAGYVVVRMTLSNGERRIFRGQPSLPGEQMAVGQKATATLQFTVKGKVGMLPA